MGCCSSICEACEPCCRRLGCSCQSKTSEKRMASIEENRACTDIPCILIFGILLIYLVSAIWGPAYANGDPDRLIHGVDHRERICGKSSGVENKPYAFWPDPTNFRFKVCTDDCNNATFTNWQGNHLSYPYESEIYLDKYCLPLTSSSSSSVLSNSSFTPNTTISGFDDISNQFQRFIGDIETAMPIIGASIAIAFAMSFFYVWLMKLCVGVLVWTTIGIICVGGILIGYTFLQKANDDELSSGDANTRKTIAYISFIFTGIFILIIFFARNRIQIAIEVIKSAGRAIGDMPLVVFFPFWPLFFIIGFFFAWVYGSIYIFSAGSTKDNTTPSQFENEIFIAEGDGIQVNATYKVIDYNDTIQDNFGPHFFLLLWVIQICIYLTFTVIAGSIANWYFTDRDEESGKKKRGENEGELTKKPVLKSFFRTVRYHLGTIFYAAFIIAVIQFIRAVIRYLERTMNGGKEPNRLQKLLFKIVDCLLWCLECCLDKISRNALIWVAIYGDPFCPAVCGSFALIWANLMRVAVITFFSTIVTMLGKIMVTLMTTGLCGLILMNAEPYKTELESPIMPLLIIFIVSFAVAMLFLTVYDTAIDTVFMCFLLDEKHNKDGHKMLADEGLRKIVQKYESQSKALAEDTQRKSENYQASSVVVSNKEQPAEQINI